MDNNPVPVFAACARGCITPPHPLLLPPPRWPLHWQGGATRPKGHVARISIEAAVRAGDTGLVKNGAAFLTIRNTGPADRLLGAESGVARTELHTHLMQDGVMRMRQVEAIEVPSGRR